jgi:pyruvate-formate lyase-activating enzyme
MRAGSSSRRIPENNLLHALVARENGEILELDGYAAAGMSGPAITPLTTRETRILPHGSELMMLPNRIPILYNRETRRMEPVATHPRDRFIRLFPVAAFNSPGYVITRICAHARAPKIPDLPLFSYGAAGWGSGNFRSAVLWIDREPRQDLRFMKPENVLAGIRRLRKIMPDNRLRLHLETCAMTYGCPAGKNFFLGRYEAPLPASRICNARCLGCLSLQQDSGIPNSQNRIACTPSSPDIAEVALFHIERVPSAVVSFGQGCEGDPLFAADAIGPAIRMIRSRTSQGTINMNTNASRPDVLKNLIEAGLDSIRVSINSFQEAKYLAYFRPVGYRFSHVLDSISLALKHGLHVAINYLNMPGFTDTGPEFESLRSFLHRFPIHQIQWRNLNYDPIAYQEIMNAGHSPENSIGMAAIIRNLRREFPALRHGYFNPPKENW